MDSYKSMLHQCKFFAGALILIICCAPQLGAQSFDYNSQLIISLTTDKSEYLPGDDGEIRFEIFVPPGYSLNADPAVFKIKQLASVDAIAFGALQKPEANEKGYYSRSTSFSLPFTVISTQVSGDQKLVFGFTLQVCADATGQCLMPSSPDSLSREITIAITEKISTALQLGEPLPLTNEDGELLEVGNRGYAAPLYKDFNGDGVPDLIAGEYKDGLCRIYINHGSAEKPVWRNYQLFEAGGDVAIVPPS